MAAAGLTLPAVMLARGMVGLGEGVALPAMNNLVANNIPLARRSTALGGCFTGFHTGRSPKRSRCHDKEFCSTNIIPSLETFALLPESPHASV